MTRGDAVAETAQGPLLYFPYVIYLLHRCCCLSVALRYNSLAILRVPNQGWEASHGTIRRNGKTQH